MHEGHSDDGESRSAVVGGKDEDHIRPSAAHTRRLEKANAKRV
jgi:hypothetical protein